MHTNPLWKRLEASTYCHTHNLKTLPEGYKVQTEGKNTYVLWQGHTIHQGQQLTVAETLQAAHKHSKAVDALQAVQIR